MLQPSQIIPLASSLFHYTVGQLNTFGHGCCPGCIPTWLRSSEIQIISVCGLADPVAFSSFVLHTFTPALKYLFPYQELISTADRSLSRAVC